MLRECEDELLKSEKKLKSQKGQNNGEVPESTVNSTTEVEVLNAFLGRLKFMRNLHSLLLHVWKRDNLNECPKLITICQESLAVMQKTASLGIQRDLDDTGLQANLL